MWARERRRTWVLLAGAAALVLWTCYSLVAAGSADSSAGRQESLRGLPERLESDGTTITVGSPLARHTFSLYEDPRCPYCKEFELTGGARVFEENAQNGSLSIRYTLASFLDGRLGGHGSARAVNALRAALEQDKFAEYHAVLYAHQPAEDIDGFTDARLLALASKVPGLRGTAFDSAVREMRYQDFVAASEKAYETSGVPGTPTVLADGEPLPEALADSVYYRDETSSLVREILSDRP